MGTYSIPDGLRSKVTHYITMPDIHLVFYTQNWEAFKRGGGQCRVPLIITAFIQVFHLHTKTTVATIMMSNSVLSDKSDDNFLEHATSSTHPSEPEQVNFQSRQGRTHNLST